MFAESGFGFTPALFAELFPGDKFAFALIGLIVAVIAIVVGSGLTSIPNNRVGIVEKLWSPKGSVTEGRILALDGEAGFQADVLRGGIHFGYWAWQGCTRAPR